MADLTTLYRGEQTPFSSFGRSNLMKGRWFTPNPELARGYANYPGGVVRSVDASASELKQAQKFKNYLKYTKNLGARISPNPEVVVAPRSLLNRASINWGQTLKHNVDVSKLAAQVYGPKILQKGIRALSFLGSLPAQAGIMTMYPTTANVDETDMNWEDFRRLQVKEEHLARRKKELKGYLKKYFQTYHRGPDDIIDERIEKVITRDSVPSGDSGRDFQPQRPDKPGGFTDPGKGSYGPWKSKGGIVNLL